ncbi:glutamine-hydrolyzing GMP synthase [Helicobacter jaachi]|uniref:GMP synthase [glutamine-hydrolyzing] n=1 Tax=Helicobacter jaachi TaxID=1677920 RepID=A0A4U8T925_9HELI|nr:glutamine-hydrolyzing GMP synthase [Helicobacter jaachi]TLD96084.1 glutamine-hydrolyzing GMP synthase [Helicobacter jaachi]
MNNVQILVLDFGSQVTQLIARRLREVGVYTEIVPYFESLDSIKARNPRGLILSGGPASVYEKGAYKPDSAIFSLGVPVLGICYGMQYIAHFFGGRVARSRKQEFGKARLHILESIESKQDSKALQKDKPFALFKGVPQDSVVWMSHADKVESLPQGFVELASSENTHYCVIADLNRKIYALQFHPEVAHSACGTQILKNFAVDICRCDTSWNMKNFATHEIARLREKVLGVDSKIIAAEASLGDFVGCQGGGDGSLLNINDRAATADSRKSDVQSQSDKPILAKEATQKVLCAVSGGVDSSVVATLLYKAIGDALIPVFVDTGLLRAGEKEAVEKMFKDNLKVPLISVNASDIFLQKLKGVTEPETKRKIIGETFIEVFEAEAKRHNSKGEIKFLAQGTLYPDVIESVSVKGPSKTIKSHHNVGGLPEWMRFELIEPLRELFKDEVRQLGRELGMPEAMLMRHPFPGPGLAIRIMGEVNAASLSILRKADSIFIESLCEAGLYDSVWQGFCVLLNVRSVGVMGDNRTYDNTIALRAVNASDGMSASFSHLPFEFLESVSNRIINEVKGINRVVYDITSKPPGTIEWE